LFALDTLSFTGKALAATGTVVDFEFSKGSGIRSSSTYYPVVHYETAIRRDTFTSRAGFGQPRYNIGDKVPILYDPDSFRAEIDAFFPLWGAPAILFAIAGVIYMLFGYAGVAALRRRMRDPALVAREQQEQAWLAGQLAQERRVMEARGMQLIEIPGLAKMMQQAHERADPAARYISRIGNRYYISLDFIDDPAQREQARELLRNAEGRGINPLALMQLWKQMRK
jgi:hypothetical protein